MRVTDLPGLLDNSPRQHSARTRAAIEANPAAVADYKSGKTTAINFLKGQVMKATRGQANPAVAEEALRKLLDLTVLDA